jgi:hypothetical protein
MYITQGWFLSVYLNTLHFYFGQPSGGLRLASDRLTDRCQLPLSLSVSALGPGLALGTFFFFIFGLYVEYMDD